MSGVVSLDEVVKVYHRARQPVRVLDGVDLAVAPGEVVILRGRSGSGKTTLLTMLAGWVQPDAGRISWGELLAGRTQRWETVTVVPQTLGLLSELTLGENIELPLRLAELPTDPVAELAARLEIAHLLDRPVGAASLGEQQRAAVARALVTSPALILADEPSCHQDLERLRLVWELLRETADRGAAVLAATHDPDAWGYADRILDLKEGRLTPAA